MKLTETQVVFYNAEKDGFLESYKDKGSLVFKAVFNDRLWQALQLPIEFYEKTKKQYRQTCRSVQLRSAYRRS